ncbi:MAG: hypothetical protein ACRDKJ_11285 [Actinomycetota bacterium]
MGWCRAADLHERAQSGGGRGESGRDPDDEDLGEDPHGRFASGGVADDVGCVVLGVAVGAVVGAGLGVGSAVDAGSSDGAGVDEGPGAVSEGTGVA